MRNAPTRGNPLCHFGNLFLSQNVHKGIDFPKDSNGRCTLFGAGYRLSKCLLLLVEFYSHSVQLPLFDCNVLLDCSHLDLTPS